MGYVIFFLLIFILFYWEYTYSPHAKSVFFYEETEYYI